MKTAEEFFEEQNGGKSAVIMDNEKQYISATWAVQLMEKYAEQKAKHAFFAGVHAGEMGIDYENGENAGSAFYRYYKK